MGEKELIKLWKMETYVAIHPENGERRTIRERIHIDAEGREEREYESDINVRMDIMDHRTNRPIGQVAVNDVFQIQAKDIREAFENFSTFLPLATEAAKKKAMEKAGLGGGIVMPGQNPFGPGLRR